MKFNGVTPDSILKQRSLPRLFSRSARQSRNDFIQTETFQ